MICLSHVRLGQFTFGCSILVLFLYAAEPQAYAFQRGVKNRVIVDEESQPPEMQPPEAPPEGAQPAPANPGEQPDRNAKPGPGNGKNPNGKPDEKGKTDEAVTNVKRKAEPPEPPNKREFDVRPEDGMIQFQFRNQAWPDLMRWLAEVSDVSLDWQELPGDYLNIATQKKQSLEYARDMFNRHLLARGFTMLEFEGNIQVVKTAGINSALVPKVDPSKLSSLPPNRFVRVSFPLSTLVATEVVTEVKSLISSNGSINALSATNRLEAMDTAGNLLEVQRILSEEQSDTALDQLAREFILEHVRATDVKDQLAAFLGLDAPKRAVPMTPEEQQQLAMQQQMMAQQAQQQGRNANAQAKKPGTPEIHLVANNRRNSVIAHAPPDKMAVIAAFVRRVDVPNENSNQYGGIDTNVKVYRLASLDPKKLVTSLLSMDALEPTTKLEVDEKNKAIIAYASLADQLIIQKTLERLDGSAREFDVIQLRRLRAEDVAGTIKSLMGAADTKKDDNSRRRMFYDPWSGMNREPEGQPDAFRVGANSQKNQLLIWANELERGEVNKFLVKLGEIPPEGGNRSRVRVIDANRSAETLEYLERLQKSWSKMAPNQLVLPDKSEFDPVDRKNPTSGQSNKGTKKDSIDEEIPSANGVDDKKGTDTKGPGKNETDGKAEAKPNPKDVSQTPVHEAISPGVILTPEMFSPSHFISAIGMEIDPPADSVEGTGSSQSQGTTTSGSTEERESVSGIADDTNTNNVDTTARRAPAAPRNNLPRSNAPRSNQSNDRSRANLPPVEIQFDERGNLVLISDDPEALDRLEQMMIDNAPPSRGYEVFDIKNTRPSWIKLNLEDYFKDDKKKDPNDSFIFIFDYMSSGDKKEEGPELGKQRKLRFLSDNDTKTLIVIGADEVQLKTISELITLWDVPEETNKQGLRYTKLIKVEYSTAEGIVETIKDAYRDLLSSNDKAFEKDAGGGGGGDGGKESKRDSSSSPVLEGAMNFGFSGKLSLGVNKTTNSIIVSARGEDLLKLVVDMIKQLDEAAMPNDTVEIVKVGGTNLDALDKALKALKKAAAGEQPNANNPGQQQQQPGANAPNQPNNNQPQRGNRGNRQRNE